MKMTSIALTSALSFALASPLVMANEPSFSYIGGSYTERDAEDGTTYDGFEAEASGRLGHRTFLAASYGELSGGAGDFGNVDLDIAYGRLGIILGETESFAAYAGPQVQYVKTDLGLGSDGQWQLDSDSATDWGAFGGVRAMVTRSVEINGEISYVDMDNSDMTSYGAGARVFLTQNLAATGEMKFGDLDGFNLGLSYHF
jgi:opacity protein-like surface antigen